MALQVVMVWLAASALWEIDMRNINMKKIAKNLCLIAACASLTACYQTVSPTAGGTVDLSKSEYLQKFPISVKKGKAEINLVLPKKSGGLSPNQTAVTAQFILDYMDKGEGLFEIWQPRGHLNSSAIHSAHMKVRSILREASIPANAISYHKYDAYGDSKASLGLKFSRYYASSPKCGTSMGNMAQNYQNKNYQTFGCAYQNNIAKMVSNPKDLLGPANMSGASAERRQIIWAKYIQGIPTGATRSDEEKVSISEVAR